jgi:hypothetical protein
MRSVQCSDVIVLRAYHMCFVETTLGAGVDVSIRSSSALVYDVVYPVLLSNVTKTYVSREASTSVM